jgi:uncharacterized protein YhbP (UPF0306 family)
MVIDIKKRVFEVLKNGYLLSLGTHDEGGVWVADVIYIYDDKLNLYWMSHPKFRHSQAINKNSHVAGTITVGNSSKEKDFGLQLEGKAEKLSGKRPDLIYKDMIKKGRKISKNPIGGILAGYSWYKLTPTKIELIDEINFKFKKQTLKLKQF